MSIIQIINDTWPVHFKNLHWCLKGYIICKDRNTTEAVLKMIKTISEF